MGQLSHTNLIDLSCFAFPGSLRSHQRPQILGTKLQVQLRNCNRTTSTNIQIEQTICIEYLCDNIHLISFSLPVWPDWSSQPYKLVLQKYLQSKQHLVCNQFLKLFFIVKIQSYLFQPHFQKNCQPCSAFTNQKSTDPFWVAVFVGPSHLRPALQTAKSTNPSLRSASALLRNDLEKYATLAYCWWSDGKSCQPVPLEIGITWWTHVLDQAPSHSRTNQCPMVKQKSEFL